MENMKETMRSHPIITGLLVVLLLILLFAIWLWVKPFKFIQEITSNPAGSYEEAVARIEAIQAEEEASEHLNPVCHTKLMTHGEKRDRVVVFLHGFTSCPEQYVPLGEQFFELGYNVYIPRQPRHGHVDIMTEDLKYLTAEELAQFGMDQADIAQGLGEHVTISGLSGGGAITTYLAQEREDVDIAAPVAPFLGVNFIPAFVSKPVANLGLMLPNFFMWWDPVHKADLPDVSEWQYRRYPIHALMANLKLGFVTQHDAETVAPVSPDIIMISNLNDASVNHDIIDQFIDTWKAHGAEVVEVYEFEKELGLHHDLISTDRSYSRPDFVNPIIIDLLHTNEEE